jgi:hypothetical protein
MKLTALSNATVPELSGICYPSAKSKSNTGRMYLFSEPKSALWVGESASGRRILFCIPTSWPLAPVGPPHDDGLDRLRVQDIDDLVRGKFVLDLS